MMGGSPWRRRQRLAILASDFDTRTYGQAKLVDLVEKTGAFEIRRAETGSVHIRPARGRKIAAVPPGGGASGPTGKGPSLS
jgi:hypothetical protein